MEKNGPKIFNINSLEQEHKLLDKLIDKLNDCDYEAVIKEGKTALKIYSKNKIFYSIISISYLNTAQYPKALKILKEADKIIPNSDLINYHMAQTYEILEEYIEAEKHFNSALKFVEEENHFFKSIILTEFGEFLWDLKRRDEALECWKSALIEDPDNQIAEKCIKKNKNKLKTAPTADSPFDDIHHFQKIQNEIFFKKMKRNEFKSKEEFEKFLSHVMNTWNNEIASRKNKLDSMSEKEKTNWFKSIDIDFDKVILFSINKKESKLKSPKPKKNKKIDLEKEEEEADWELINSRFPFLPEGGAFILPFCVPALTACGMSEERFFDIFDNGDYDDDEEELLLWASDLTSALFMTLISKIKKEIKSFEDSALAIALEFLPPAKAKSVIKIIKRELTNEVAGNIIDDLKNKRNK